MKDIRIEHDNVDGLFRIQCRLKVKRRTLHLLLFAGLALFLNAALMLNFQNSEFNRKARKGLKAALRSSKKEKKSKIPLDPSELAFKKNASFSACLLVKDDNEIMGEWLAYHYHTLRLRNLIIAVDPESQESPSEVLERWGNNTDLRITQWSDLDYMPEKFLKTGIAPKEWLVKKEKMKGDTSFEAIKQVSNHRYRQRVFLASCMRKLKQDGHNWMLHIDTDEYVVPSKALGRDDDNSDISVEAPSLEKAGALFKYIRKMSDTKQKKAAVKYPCITMSRYLFGSIEDQIDSESSGFDRKSFETLRWHHHASVDHELNGMPKVIMDIAAVPESEIPDEAVFSIHRPIKEFCRKSDDLDPDDVDKQPLAVNHYLGSWERYNSRADARRNQDVYNQKAQVNDAHDRSIETWLDGFITKMGRKKAALLLNRPLKSVSES